MPLYFAQFFLFYLKKGGEMMYLQCIALIRKNLNLLETSHKSVKKKLLPQKVALMDENKIL
jgi:hypothetical protein